MEKKDSKSLERIAKALEGIERSLRKPLSESSEYIKTELSSLVVKDGSRG